MTHILLTDLETGSTEKDAAAFSMAALLFNVNHPNSVEEAKNAFVNKLPFDDLLYERLHVGDQWMEGRRLDSATQAWWQQERLKKSRQELRGGTGSFRDALKAYVKLVDKLIKLHKEEHGADSKIVVYFRDRQFDDNIIQHAAEQYGVKLPYIFNQRRDVRTYIDAKLDTTIGYIPDFKPFPELDRHHAMVDVLRDAASMCEAKRRSIINHTQ
jgi:hypothetical protein